MLTAVRSQTENLLAVAEAAGTVDLVAILTLVLLLLHGSDGLLMHVPMVTLVILALVFAPLRRDERFWFVVTVVFILSSARVWFQLDNHKYLLGYWCLALFLCLRAHDQERALAVAARWLVGLSFAFAVFWKITSGDFLNSTFFQYALLIDERFFDVAARFGGVTADMADVNTAARAALINYDSVLSQAALQSTPALIRLAQAITVWTLVIEVLVAAAFLLVWRWRDVTLLAFIFSTYAVAPVIGYGWLLAIMGVAQSKGLWRLGYIAALLLVQLYRLPITT